MADTMGGGSSSGFRGSSSPGRRWGSIADAMGGSSSSGLLGSSSLGRRYGGIDAAVVAADSGAVASYLRGR